MNNIPRNLVVFSFKDFCIRSDEIYDYFWEYYAPYNDISIYRDYLLERVVFSSYEARQEAIAGVCWEYLMGDLSKERLFIIFCSNIRKK